MCGNPKLKPWFATIASWKVSRCNGICEVDKTSNIAHQTKHAPPCHLSRAWRSDVFFLVCWSAGGRDNRIYQPHPNKLTQLRRSQVWQSAIKLKALVNRWSVFLSSIESSVWSRLVADLSPIHVRKRQSHRWYLWIIEITLSRVWRWLRVKSRTLGEFGEFNTLLFVGLVIFYGFYHDKSPFFSTIWGICLFSSNHHFQANPSTPPSLG